MKRFEYDAILDEENICNLKDERKTIEAAVNASKKIVVYGPRNYGKTSLVKNVILPKFRKKNKGSFVFFSDLMEVKSLESIGRRILNDFERCFAESFPLKSLMENAKRFLTSLRPQITFEPESGKPTLSISPTQRGESPPIGVLFEAVSKIAKERPVIVVLDEFQDIAFVEEAQGLFRNAFQKISKIPIIVMGSKRHILANILAKPEAPLAMFGEDIEFRPIPYDEYHDYIVERFEVVRLDISEDDSKYLQDELCRNPEAINIVCAEMMDLYEDKSITQGDIHPAIGSVVDKRRSRYEEFISHFTESNESVLTSIAKHGRVKHPNSKAFLETVKPTSRMVGIIVKNFFDRSVIDKDEQGYFISDPLLAFYLAHYR